MAIKKEETATQAAELKSAFINASSTVTLRLLTETVTQIAPESSPLKQFLEQKGNQVQESFVNGDRTELERIVNKAPVEVKDVVLSAYDSHQVFIRYMHESNLKAAQAADEVKKGNAEAAARHMEDSVRAAMDAGKTDMEAKGYVMDTVVEIGAQSENTSKEEFRSNYKTVLGDAAAQAFGPGSVLPLVMSDDILDPEAGMTAALMTVNREVEQEILRAINEYAKDNENAEELLDKAEEIKRLAEKAREAMKQDPGGKAFKTALKDLDKALKGSVGVSLLHALRIHLGLKYGITPTRVE